VKPSGTVVVRCLRCRHEATLSDQALVQFGLKPGAPISTFVKRLRCHNRKRRLADGATAPAAQNSGRDS